MQKTFIGRKYRTLEFPDGTAIRVTPNVTFEADDQGEEIQKALKFGAIEIVETPNKKAKGDDK